MNRHQHHDPRPDTQNDAPLAPLGQVAVVGAGLGGLATAAYLARAGRSVTVFDARGGLGGRARTDERRGFLFNQGPHALYRGGQAWSVLTDLGIKPQGGLPGSNSTILRNGKVHVGPVNASTLARTSGLRIAEKLDLARALARLPKLKAEDHRGLSVNQWLDGLVGTDGGRALMEALVRLTTYANQPDRLSADVAIGQIQLGLGTGVLYLDGGWQQLIDALARSLEARPNVTFRLSERLDELPDARAVVVATGDPASTSRLTGRRLVADGATTGHSGVGPPARAACLDLGVSERPDRDLVIGVDDPFYLSNHSCGAALAPDGHWQVAAVQYLGEGDHGDRDGLTDFAAHGWGDGDKVDGSRLDRSLLDRAVVESRYLHDMTTVAAIPLASGGGLSGRPGVNDTGHANVFMVGDWVGPVGHLADASLASARAAATAVDRLLDSAVTAR